MNRDGLDKLLDFTTPDPAVWSCYLSVSSDPAALRGLPAQVTGLLTAAAVQVAPIGHPPRELSPADLGPALDAARAHGRDWLGHSVAIFTAGQLGLLEVAVLPCRVPERAVLGVRPYIRPLLTAMARRPRHLAAIVDRGHARIYLIDGPQVTPMTRWSGRACERIASGGGTDSRLGGSTGA